MGQRLPLATNRCVISLKHSPARADLTGVKPGDGVMKGSWRWRVETSNADDELIVSDVARCSGSIRWRHNMLPLNLCRIFGNQAVIGLPVNNIFDKVL